MDIAKRSDGKYARVTQSGGMASISTPMDAELSKLNISLEKTVVSYGGAVARAASDKKMSMLASMAPAVAAERAAYKTSGAGMSAGMSTYDLLDAVKNGSIKLKDVKKDDLPEEMKKMSLKEKESYLANKEKERESIQAKIEKLSKKRAAYIAAELKKQPEKRDSFDIVVQKFIKTQAARKGIAY